MSRIVFLIIFVWKLMGYWFYWFIEIKILEENLVEYYVVIFIVY